MIPKKECLTLQGLERKSAKEHTHLKQYVYPKVLKYNSIETYMPLFPSEFKSARSYVHSYMSHQNSTAHTLLRLPVPVFPYSVSQLALPGMPQANLWDLICPKIRQCVQMKKTMMFYTVADELQQRVTFWQPPPKYWRSAFNSVLRQLEGIKLIPILRWAMQGRIALLTTEN